MPVALETVSTILKLNLIKVYLSLILSWVSIGHLSSPTPTSPYMNYLEVEIVLFFIIYVYYSQYLAQCLVLLGA